MGLLASLLDSVVDFVLPRRADALLVQEAAPDALAKRIDPTLIETTRPEAVGLLPFRDALVRAAVHEAKYHASERAQHLLAAALAEYLDGFAADSFDRAVIIPLPLSRERHAERGFNQCERIARAARPPFPIDTRLLARVKDTEHQARLTREVRRKNVQGAFGTTRPADPALTYIVLDDVITTGASMQAAVLALRAAGGRRIVPLALAH